MPFERDTSSRRLASVVVGGDPPDGGFGWVVVMAGFLNHILILGLGYTIGVYYPTFQDPQDLAASTKTVAWVATAHLCMLFASGPLAGYLLNRHSTLVVCFGGSLIASAGCIVAAFSPNILLVIIFFGLVSGTGTGLMFMSTVTSVSRWFSSKRSLATGLAVSGAGFGVFAFSPLIRLMIQEWGRKEALLIEGALALNGCVFALLLRPVPPNTKRMTKFTPEKQMNAEEMLPLKSQAEQTTLPEKAKEIPQKSGRLLSSSQMWRDLNFWLFVLSQVFTFFGASGPLVYLYSRANLDLGIEALEAAFVVSIMGIFNTVGRVGFGVLGNVLPRGRFYLLAGSIAGFGAATAICPMGESYPAISAYAAVFGAGYGAMFALTSVVVVDLFGLPLFQTVYGTIGFFRGAAIISAPPLYGLLIGWAGGQHDLLFVVTGTASVLAGTLLLLIPLSDALRRCKAKRRPVNV